MNTLTQTESGGQASLAYTIIPAAHFTLDDITAMIGESLKMQMFDHRNVLTLIGVSIDVGEAPCIVMPFMANGSLLSYLKKERPNLTIAEGADEELVSRETCDLNMCMSSRHGICILMPDCIMDSCPTTDSLQLPANPDMEEV